MYLHHYSIREAAPGLIGPSPSASGRTCSVPLGPRLVLPSCLNRHSAKSGRESRRARRGASWTPPAKPGQWRRKWTPGENLSPGPTLIAVGKALESHRLRVQPASFMAPLVPAGRICILTGKYGGFYAHMGGKCVRIYLFIFLRGFGFSVKAANARSS